MTALRDSLNRHWIFFQILFSKRRSFEELVHSLADLLRFDSLVKERGEEHQHDLDGEEQSDRRQQSAETVGVHELFHHER